MAWVGFCLLIKWKNFYRGNKRQQCNLIYCLFYIAWLRLGYKPDKKEHKMMGKWRVNPAPLQYSSFFFPLPRSNGHCQWPTSHKHTDVALTAPSAKLDNEILAEGNCPGHTWGVLDVLPPSSPSYALNLSQLFILLWHPQPQVPTGVSTGNVPQHLFTVTLLWHS